MSTYGRAMGTLRDRTDNNNGAVGGTIGAIWKYLDDLQLLIVNAIKGIINNIAIGDTRRNWIFNKKRDMNCDENSNKNRNMKQYRLLSIRYIAVAIVLIAGLSIGSLFIVDASDRDITHLNKYYTSITIQANDTLWDIADQYNIGSEDKTSYMQAIKKMNHMTDDTIYSGQSILIYYYSEDIK